MSDNVTSKVTKSTAILVALLIVVAIGAVVWNTSFQPEPTTITQTREITKTATKTATVTAEATRDYGTNLLSPSPAVPDVPSGKKDGTLIIGWNDSGPENYDPWHIGYGDLYIIWGMYDTLVMMGTDGKLYPSVATGVYYDPDELSYTVTLRDDVYFHDGSLLTSKDVVATFQRGMDNPLRRSYTVGTIQSVVAIDEFTVKFTQSRTYVDFVTELASHTSIHKADRLKEFGEDIINQPPMGSGPFKFVDYVPGDKMVLERNDDYWAGPANVKEIVVRYITDPTVRALEVQKGGIHMYRMVQKTLFKDVNSAGAQLYQNPGGYCMPHLTMPLERPGWNDVNVRKAVNHALDRQSFIDVSQAGVGEVAQGIIPPYMGPYYDPAFKGYEYDVTKAKEYLAKSAYPNGFTIQFVSGSSLEQVLAPLLVDQLGEIGITVEVDQVDGKVKSKRTLTFDAPMFLGNWCGSTPAPGGIFEIWWHTRQSKMYGWNTFHTNYTDASVQLDKVIDGFMAESDVAKRTPLVREFQQIIHDNAMYAPLWHNVYYIVTNYHVQGFDLIPHQGIGQFMLTHAPQIGFSVYIDDSGELMKPGNNPIITP